MESLYMSRQDLLGIKYGLIVLLKQLERQQQQQQQGQNTNDNDDDATNSSNDADGDDTLRGLEELGSKMATERRRRIDTAVQTVLKRQNLGYNDEFISELYGKCVRQSSLKAHLRGLRDEQESPYQSSPRNMAMVRS
jgi:hypothetical protein